MDFRKITPLPSIEEEGQLPRLRLMWRYRKQFQAMASASVIFLAGGMKMAWATFESPATSSGTTLDVVNLMKYLPVYWFLGIIVGILLAAEFVQKLTKNMAHCSAGVLLFTGGVIFCLFPTNFAALLVSCLCEGCAFGLNQVQAFVTGGEVTHKSIRGLILSSERIFLWLGVCLQLCYTHLWFAVELNDYTHIFHVHQLHGVVIALLGLSAIVFALAYRVESPIFLLMLQREGAACHVLKQLYSLPLPSTELLRLRGECQQLIAHDCDSGYTKAQLFLRQNLLPLLKVMALRCFASVSLSAPFNRAFLDLSYKGFDCDMNCLYLMAATGLAGSIMGGLLVDQQGRRKLAVLSMLAGVLFAFLVGVIYQHLQSLELEPHKLDFEIAACALLAYQFITCCGLGVAASVYVGEAFSVSLKAPCMASVLVGEQLLQLCLFTMSLSLSFDNAQFYFGLGSLCLLMGVLSFLFLPETKMLTLRECLKTLKK